MLATVVLVVSCKNTSDVETYKSSAELNGKTEIAPHNGHAIFTEAIRNTSGEQSRTGSRSVKVDTVNKYGFKAKVTHLKKGDFVRASVWQFQGGQSGAFSCLVKVGDKQQVLKSRRFKFTGQDWHKHTHEVYIETDNTTLEFYVFSGKKTTYFDDLVIQKYSSVPPVDTSLLDVNQIQLSIPFSSDSMLKLYKLAALELGVIGENEKQWVSAFLIDGKDSLAVDLRLKGDWTDHLNSGKDSYRIKLKGNNQFMGMRSFSIQHPKTRNYMHAWWMHQLLEKEGLLTTRYAFMPVYINGSNNGVYAVEEHFEKELVTQTGRPEGPILKMDESGLWEHTLYKKLNPNIQQYPAFEASVITPFKKNKTLKNQGAKAHFLAGMQLVKQFRALHQYPTQLFNLDLIAKYYALLELGNVQHGHQWHNKRFYYNPKSKRLENIGFDLNAGVGVNDDLYLLKKLQPKKGPKQWLLILPILKDTVFRSAFMKYLRAFSDEAYIQNNFDAYKNQLSVNEKLLAAEVEDYRFDTAFYFQRAKKIRQQYAELDSVWTVFISDNRPLSGFVRKANYQLETDSVLLKDISINTYVAELPNKTYRLIFENFHLNNINIIGYKSRSGKIIYFKEAISMSAFSEKQYSASVVVSEFPQSIVFTAQNTGTKPYQKAVNNWPF